MQRTIDVIIPCKDGEEYLPRVIHSIANQVKVDGWHLAVIVIDDGSKMPVRSSDLTDEIKISIIRNEKSLGRSGAINKGIKKSRSDYCWIIDADCVVDDSLCMKKITDTLDNGVSFCFGSTYSNGSDFWSLYHSSVSKKRNNAPKSSNLTTACFIADRLKIVKVGGFSERYKHYGFEDKDLISLIIKTYGRDAIVLNPELKVIHSDKTDLQTVLSKFNISAKYSAQIFSSRFPYEYRKLSYSKFDAATVSRTRIIFLRLLLPLLVISPIFGYFLEKKWLPLNIKIKMVQALCAISYFDGSITREV